MKFNRAAVARHFPTDSFEVYLTVMLPGKSTVDYAVSVTVQQAEVGEAVWDPPPIRLEREAAQLLMDDLWACGIHPTHAKAGDDLIEALRAQVVDSNAVRDKLLNHVLLPSED